MLPKLDNTRAAVPVDMTTLRSTASVAAPELDSMIRLNQMALSETLPNELITQLVGGNALAIEQAGTLASQQSSEKTILSATGLLINALLQSDVSAPQTKPLEVGQPILAKAITDNPQLASQLSSQLQKTVSNSGLFYESHLQQWSNGQRTLSQLLAEPQNQASRHHVDPAQWVPAQLSTQEQQRFTWQGQAWPGQAMQWQVQEDTSEPSQSKNGTPQTAWKSVLLLNFPGLGKVNASLRLVGEHVRVQLQAEDEATVTALKTQGDVLGQSLAASGTTLDGLTVNRDELP